MSASAAGEIDSRPSTSAVGGASKASAWPSASARNAPAPQAATSSRRAGGDRAERERLRGERRGQDGPSSVSIDR